MRSLHTKRRILAVSLLGALALNTAFAAQSRNAPANAAASPSGPQAVDGIAAVVNKKVITFRQLDVQTKAVQQQLAGQNIPVPDLDTLRRQVLQRMINDEIEAQEAERLGIEVTQAHVDRAAQSVAERNRISVQKLREEVEKSGVPWDAYLATLRQEVRNDMMRQRVVDGTIMISDAEIDAFLKNQGRQQSAGLAAPGQPQPPQATGPTVLSLAQILVAVPEGSPPNRVRELRARAESILARLRQGADFAGVAASSSDDPQALNGGDLGTRPEEGWPELFLKATQNLQPGQVSDIVQSGNGFHILKVTARQQAGSAPGTAPAPGAQMGNGAAGAQQQGPMMVTQTHARHILIKTSKVMNDEQAKARLEQIRMRLNNNESFEDLARRHSEDTSAPQGGDLGWLTPGETVPAFEQAMNALQPGQISEPVQSQFGWHLIQVLERRTRNMENEFRRMQARQFLFERRAEPAFEDWLNQLRGQAYIDNRLDPEANRNR